MNNIRCCCYLKYKLRSTALVCAVIDKYGAIVTSSEDERHVVLVFARTDKWYPTRFLTWN